MQCNPNILQTVDAAVIALQTAVEKRRLYPCSHPEVAETQRQAFEALKLSLADQDAVEVMRVDSRVVFDSVTMPSSSLLSDGLFKTLAEAGIDRIRIHAALTHQDLTAFLDDLTTRHRDDGIRPRKSISFGFITSTVETIEYQAMAGRINTVWQGLSKSGAISPELVGGMVAEIVTAVTRHVHALIPLAAVRQDDEYTFLHTANVAVLSTALGQAIGLSDSVLEDLTEAALLHDVGKMQIPNQLLNKAGKLNDAELVIIRQHPVTGAAMLLNQPRVSRLSPIVAFEHHLGIDGSGYPPVPHNWKINLASQVVRVADIYDALRTHRSYRRGLGEDKAMEILRSEAGAGTDPDLVDIFERDVVRRFIPDTSEAAA